MADGLDIGEIMRRTVQANARFYKGWVDLSLDYLRGLSEIFGAESAPSPAPEVEGTDAGAGVLVLEAEAGAPAGGAFLVTNDLGRKLTCELMAAEFSDVAGERVPAQPSFDPPRLELAPGEQRVVQVTVPIDARLTPGVAYSGQFSVKGMDGFAIPVVLRRRHPVAESPIDREVTAEKPARSRSGPAGEAGRPGRGQAGGKQSAGRKRAARRKQ